MQVMFQFYSLAFSWVWQRYTFLFSHKTFLAKIFFLFWVFLENLIYIFSFSFDVAVFLASTLKHFITKMFFCETCLFFAFEARIEETATKSSFFVLRQTIINAKQPIEYV